MGKLIDTDALKNANFRTGIGLMKYIEALPEAVTRCTKCEYFETFDEIENFILEKSMPGDVLITMGAGDVYRIGEKLLGK